MKLEEVTTLYDGCSSYATQYYPTFRKVLEHLQSEDVRDICIKYEVYKDKIPGITSDAKTKHIKSLCEKLTKHGIMHPVHPVCLPVSPPIAVIHENDGEPSSDEDGEVEDVYEDAQDFVRKIKHLSWKAQVLQDFYDTVIDHIHHLPPEVLGKIVKQNVSSRLSAVYELGVT